MEKFVITGGKPLQGSVKVSGSKNVVLKALVAACLTSEEVVIENVPLIADVSVMIDIMRGLGAEVALEGNTVKIVVKNFVGQSVALEKAALLKASFMFMAPLLVRVGEAIIPNPGGCRLGARPIDRIIDGIREFGAEVEYNSEDGYFHAKSSNLTGITYKFAKNTHTGTETLIMISVLANGKTVLQNAAEEPEVDELIGLLNRMGANVRRSAKREITIIGVSQLHGATFKIQPDRNEIVTFAVGAILTEGDIFIKGATKSGIKEFLDALDMAGGGWEEKKDGLRFYFKGDLKPTDITTSIYPGFMTDWQAPWAVLMTHAHGKSTIHETVFENKFGYISDLKRMGVDAELFNPEVSDPELTYNFNLSDDDPSYFHGVKIHGPAKLHNAVMEMENLRAGAAIVLAALAAKGRSTIFGIEKLDRGYERFDQRLSELGANIKRVTQRFS